MGRRVDLRQAQPPDFTIEPATGRGQIDARVVAHRRGAHRLPPVGARRRGPLGLGTCTFDADGGADLLVYPDVFAAQRLIVALRRGRFRDPGLRTRGPLGLGTEFESVRDYLPDDDVRQINWQATERLGRPMSNQYRIEQDRDVVCLLDAGRLMAAPLPRAGGDTDPGARITRLDAAVDAVTMVALVADELGDRCGVTVYDSEIRRRLAPRAGGKAVVRTILDVEPTLVDSDHDLAFRAVGGVKRALVVVLTDLVDEAAARSLLDAVPVLARRHAVVVASVRDPDLDAPLTQTPQTPRDVYAGAVALDVLDGRAGDQTLAAPGRDGDRSVAGAARRSVRARLPPAQVAGAVVNGSLGLAGRELVGRTAAPQHQTPVDRAQREPDRDHGRQTGARGSEKALDQPGDDEPRRGAEDDLDRRALLGATRPRAAAYPGR